MFNNNIWEDYREKKNKERTLAAAAALANKEDAFLHNFHLKRMFVINSLELQNKTVHSVKIDHNDNYLALGC